MGMDLGMTSRMDIDKESEVQSDWYMEFDVQHGWCFDHIRFPSSFDFPNGCISLRRIEG